MRRVIGNVAANTYLFKVGIILTKGSGLTWDGLGQVMLGMDSK